MRRYASKRINTNLHLPSRCANVKNLQPHNSLSPAPGPRISNKPPGTRSSADGLIQSREKSFFLDRPFPQWLRSGEYPLRSQCIGNRCRRAHSPLSSAVVEIGTVEAFRFMHFRKYPGYAVCPLLAILLLASPALRAQDAPTQQPPDSSQTQTDQSQSTTQERA